MMNSTALIRKAEPDEESNSLQNAFLTAMLLTGSASIAEAAVLKAIENSGNNSDWDRLLLRRTVEASLRMPSPPRPMSSEELERACNLPLTLRAVLSLQPSPRQCFVLRVLLALPRRECALLLDISEAEVASYSGAAASGLASISFEIAVLRKNEGK